MMARFDHPSYGRHTRAHHIARAQASRFVHSQVDAATRSGAIRPIAPTGRMAHQRSIGTRITVAFLGLFTIVALAQSCDGRADTSLFCAEAFCEVMP